MKCPKCDSDNIDQTGEFDLTVIDREECHHDFKCGECGCLFVIVYAPIDTDIVGQSEILDYANVEEDQPLENENESVTDIRADS